MSAVSLVRSFEDALIIAAKAHRGQLYRAPYGAQPYIFHPTRVALAVRAGAGVDVEGLRIVAVLHDVEEDSGLVIRLDAPWGTALRALCRNKEEESYAEYIHRLVTLQGTAGEVARRVKAADLRDNLAHIQPGHREGMRSRYERALRRLDSEASYYAGWWAVETNVTCVVCPACGFTFDVCHTNADGLSYTCPNCDCMKGVDLST